MDHAARNTGKLASSTHPTPQSDARPIPTFLAADLLEKLIVERDAQAVDRVVAARAAIRRHAE